MKSQLIKKFLGWPFIMLLAICVLLALFILEENIRGHILLTRYKSELRAKGEKLTLAELGLPKPMLETNRAAVLLSLVDQIKKEAHETSETAAYVPEGLVFVKPGVAIVMHRQRGPIKRLYPSGVGLSSSWDNLSETMARVNVLVEQATQVLRQGPVEFPLDYRPGIEMRLPHLNRATKLQKWLDEAGLLKLHNGDINGALDCLEAMRNLTDSLADERNQICQLTRARIGTSVLSTTWELLHADNLREVDLERLQQICTMGDVTTDLIHTFEVDVVSRRKFFQDARNANWTTGLRHCLRPDYLLGGGWIELLELPAVLMWRVAWLDQDERKALELGYSSLRGSRVGVSTGCWVKAAPHLPPDLFGRRSTGLYDRWRYPLSPLFFNATWRKAVLIAYRFQIQRELALAAIALKRYELRYAKLPTDLDSMVPTFLSQTPRDYINGNKLHYRVGAGGAFTLYSVGDDGVDDGGDASTAKPRKPMYYSMWDGRDAVWPMAATLQEVEEWDSQRALGAE